MATYTDDFNRANEDPLANGPGWTTAPGLSAMKIVTNQCLPQSGADSGSRVTTTSAADHSAACKVPTGGNNGPMVRCKTSGAVKGGYALALQSGNIVCYRMDQFSYTNINMTGGGTTFTSANAMKLGVVGTTLTGYKDGVSFGTATDATYQTELGFGLWCFNGTQGVLDDFDGSDGAAAGGGNPWYAYAQQ